MGAEPATPRLQVGDLEGRHVRLERLDPAHVDALSAAAAIDRSSYEFTVVPDGTAATQAYVDDLLGQAGARRVAPFVQRRLADGAVVGATRFMEPRWPLGRTEPDEVEIGGTWLRADAQRTAINTEAKLLLLTHAFEGWHVQRVAICTDARNARSRRAIERIGATFEGVLRRHRPSWVPSERERLRDSAMYSIVGAQWPSIRAALSERVWG